MKYKHGFWALLSASALSMGMLVGCGDDGGSETPAPSTGGSSGLAGTGGSSQAGSSQAGSSQAGTSNGGTSNGGTSNGGSSNGGSNNGGSSNGGTSNGGSSNGGSAGSTGNTEAIENVGSECEDDTDCGNGGKCLTATGTDIFSGGPARGYCTVDCTDWLNLSEEEQKTAQYPCDPTVDVSDPNATISRLCLNFAENEGDPAKGYCVQLCSFGDPPLTGGITGQLSPDKCNGRADVACFPLTTDHDNNPATPEVLSVSFCRPLCQSDDQCDAGSSCDKVAGVCKKDVPSNLKKNGALCKISADPNAAPECEGFCARLYDAEDPATPASKKDLGICIDPCIFNDVSESCGGLSNGLCGFGIFSPNDPNAPAESISMGSGDVGGCIKNGAAGGDVTCAWQEGWFTQDFGQIGKLCLAAPECAEDNDCAKCTSADQCPQGDTCDGGYCKKAGAIDLNGQTCQKVDAVCGKSFCADHEIKGLPLNDPSVDCSGSAGAGGSGAAGSGAGGSDAGAGGAAAGSGGAAAGSGGAAAGSGGAAAGSGGSDAAGSGGAAAGSGGAAAGSGGAAGNLATRSTKRREFSARTCAAWHFVCYSEGQHAFPLSFCGARSCGGDTGLYLRIQRRTPRGRANHPAKEQLRVAADQPANPGAHSAQFGGSTDAQNSASSDVGAAFHVGISALRHLFKTGRARVGSGPP